MSNRNKFCMPHLFGKAPDYPLERFYLAECPTCENNLKAGRCSKTDPPPLNAQQTRDHRTQSSKKARDARFNAACLRQKNGWSAK